MNARPTIADRRLPPDPRPAMSRHPRTPTRRRRIRPAYSIIEVMMAMGIFVIGFTAVIALFPTAMVLQREIAEDLVIQRITEQATTVLRNKPVTTGALNHTYGSGNALNLPPGLYPLPNRRDPDLGTTVQYLRYYPVGDRSYPATELDPTDRRYYWVPMVRKLQSYEENSASADDWMVYILIMRVDEPYGQRTDPDGPKDLFTSWYAFDPDIAVHSVGFMAMANPAPLAGPGANQAGVFQEQPYVPRICMIRTQVNDPNGLARRLELAEGNLIPNGQWQVADVAQAENTPTHYKIRAGDIIIDQYGTVHTVMAADHRYITLRDTIHNPASANDLNGFIPEPRDNGDPVYIWYVPAAAYGTGTNYAQFEIGPAARSPLRAVVAIPGAVVAIP
jgi:type II secretory pathway pseudopilin PulG